MKGINVSDTNKLDSIEHAVEVEIEHIYELYGIKGLVHALERIKRILDDEEK